MGEHALNQGSIQPWHQRLAQAAVFRPQSLFIHALLFISLLRRARCSGLLLCRAIAANGLGLSFKPMTLATTLQARCESDEGLAVFWVREGHG
ncbi:MAG: hypothetical protein ACJ0GY_06530 [Synechococcus sp.]